MPFVYDITKLETKAALISFLELDEETFEHIVNYEEKHQNSQTLTQQGIIELVLPPFFRHEIPKRNGGTRTVWEATYLKNNYKTLARRLGSFLSSKLSGFPRDSTFGFVNGRNIRENAYIHCGHRYLLSVDIESFFATIKMEAVANLFTQLGVNRSVSELLSRFVTIQEELPAGLATSPLIANAMFYEADFGLEKLSSKFGAVYSRYADDLSFSSDSTLPAVPDIKAVIERSGFLFNPKKTRHSKLGQSHFVTGLSVSDTKQPHPPKEMKRKLRQELYFADKFGLDEHLAKLGLTHHPLVQREINRIDGLVKYICHLEPNAAKFMRSRWADILKEANARPSFAPKNQNKGSFSLYVDEAEYTSHNNSKFLALAISATQHPQSIAHGVLKIVEKFSTDL